ncbi:MAG: aminotransferase class III-fold pyridoxal phosphate-dependent enzyme [Acidobacteria bacterium]|nr:aminotransferase class III-fold pyridoxal phosphate-dependent enzyme [Acidobacteriota bacterium]
MRVGEEIVRQPVSTCEAESIAAQVYGLSAVARELSGEYDENFHLRSSTDGEFVLKLMHPSRTIELVDLQCAAFEWIETTNSSLHLPRVVKTKNGEPYTSISSTDGDRRLVWLLRFIPGKILAETRPHSPELLRAVGAFLGELDSSLTGFHHPAAQRSFKWDLAQAGWVRQYLEYVPGGHRRDLVERFLADYDTEILPVLSRLRKAVIYGDGNDYNIVVRQIWPVPEVGAVDFGDMHEGVIVSEPAIGAAYAMLRKEDALTAATEIVRGFHRTCRLQEEEIALLFPLIATRLVISVVNSAYRKTVNGNDPYITVSEVPAWDALEKLAAISPKLAQYRFRDACGLEPVSKSRSIRDWLRDRSATAASLFEADLRAAPSRAFDLSVGSSFLGADPNSCEVRTLAGKIFRQMEHSGLAFGIGAYDEARVIYNAPQFGNDSDPVGERRTIHLGIDLFVPSGTALHAPIDGVVHLLSRNSMPLDYGPLVVLKHCTDTGDEFFTLYGHLTAETLQRLQVGQSIRQGAGFAHVGDIDENGGWPPHVHFQIIVDLLDLAADFPGVAVPSQRDLWKSLSPDPNLLLGIPEDRFPDKGLSRDEALQLRKALIGSSERLSYRTPLKIVRGWMQYLYDENGRAYLDAYNNVPLVGHSHPAVIRAVQEQIALLNTNTRYLHDNILRYAKRLTQLLPEPLRVCYFVNSGSEANELALRLARTHTGHNDVIVLEHAYHGHTTTLTECSPYKFNGPGGKGRPDWVRVAPMPDDYRGPYRRDDPDAGKKFARHVGELLFERHGRGVAAYIAESLPSVGGQIVFPIGYLDEVYRQVHAAGAICIADEVQVGFARLGSHFWGFETQEVVPDIVVLGKPIGNGFPVAAVVTTKAIASSFDNGMEFFSTFGGNPVACAAGLAVLDVLEKENLQSRALDQGRYLRERLQALESKYPVIGDVRGMGLFLGIDLVLNRVSREPAPLQADYIANRLREKGILAGTDGPEHNVLKLRPPLIFSRQDCDLLLHVLDDILEEDPAQA